MAVWCSDGLLVWSRRRGEKKEYGAKYLGNKLCLLRHWTLDVSHGLSEEGERGGKKMLLGIWAISFACLDMHVT